MLRISDKAHAKLTLIVGKLGRDGKDEIVFRRDAIRFRLTWLKGEYQFIEVPKEQY
jgi:hypothetical protein